MAGDLVELQIVVNRLAPEPLKMMGLDLDR
jgi:hypothetical protein